MAYRLPNEADHEGVVFWPAVADIFIGFLALVLIAGIVTYMESEKERGKKPPIAKLRFSKQFEKSFENIPASKRPKVTDIGFSEIEIFFPGDLLFDPCEVELKKEGNGTTVVESLRQLVKTFDPCIRRVQITGHTDSDRPGRRGRCHDLAIETNWELSSLRAITMVSLLAPEDRSGLAPEKIWAVGVGQYQPVAEGFSAEAKEKNRRIEVVIRFAESEEARATCERIRESVLKP